MGTQPSPRNLSKLIKTENSKDLLDWYAEEMDSGMPADGRGRPAYTAQQLRREIIRRMDRP